MTRRLVVHIGQMKAATSYLQGLFDLNAGRLAESGFDWMGSQLNQHAVLDFQNARMLPPDGKGSWRRFCAEVHESNRDVVISMELLAGMPAARIERFMAPLGPATVDVVITARDLAGFVRSHWQETTQNRGTVLWADYVEAACTPPDADAARRTRFWSHHDLPAIIDAWTTVADAARIFVVTIPPVGASSIEVWRRFATVLGIDPAGYVEPAYTNTALGAGSAELMRRVNLELQDLPWALYQNGFKAALAKRSLRARSGLEPKPSLSARQLERLREIAKEQARGIVARKVTVVGDLDDLLPGDADSQAGLDPSDLPDGVLLDAAITGLVGLGRRVGELQRRCDVLEEQAETQVADQPTGRRQRGTGRPGLRQLGQGTRWRRALGALKRRLSAGRATS